MSAVRSLRARGWSLLAAFVLAVATAVVLAAGAFTTSAQAQPPAPEPPDCPEGEVCFWKQPSFGGTKVVKEAVEGKCTDLPWGAQSVYNRSDFALSLYSGHGCNTKIDTIYPETFKYQISPAAFSFKAGPAFE